MKEHKIESALNESAKALDIHLSAQELSQFLLYYNELIIWNRKINLVSVKSELDIPIKHFIDSLTPLPLIKNNQSSLIDIGAGAGFPGIPLKIIKPSLKLVLLEPIRKRASFLKHISRILCLKDTLIICDRVESLCLKDDFRNHFDFVISRATFKLPYLVKISSHFLTDRGILIAMKGKSIREELKEAVSISEPLGLQYISCHEVRLPTEAIIIRNNVVFRKYSSEIS